MINQDLSSNIQRLDNSIYENSCYMKREDLLPFSFGGNKARKAFYFFEEIKKENYDYVITYGSASSNHCRVIANLCKKENLKCTIITTEKRKDTFNRKMCCDLFHAEMIRCDVNEVKQTIVDQMEQKKSFGYRPYFIQGGGHGNIGTEAYVQAYEEIKQFEKENDMQFDYIFHASGTGTTQAGLVIGNYLNQESHAKVIGISIAREREYGKNIILDSIKDYQEKKKIDLKNIEKEVIFIDTYRLGGYGKYNQKVEMTIKEILIQEGIALDTTYTGKAFYGMKEYIKENEIKGKNILFIHTGGTPLFFDYLKGVE